MTYFRSLSTAGFIATAISYGPARMGFGLFVPEFREAFDLSGSAVGFVSGFGFSGFFCGLLIAQFLLNRKGPATPVLTGLCAATAGLGIVAIAPNVFILALGVFVAASSAGFAWTPFNDAVHRKISAGSRGLALSEISTGTSIGIAAAGLAALVTALTGVSWRICWAGFAAAGAMALLVNWFGLRDVDQSTDDRKFNPLRTVRHKAARPLFTIAFVYGTTSSIYISFAADHMLNSGGVPGLPPSATAGVVFFILGIFGFFGLLTARVRDAIGLPLLLRVLMLGGAFSLISAGLWPTSWAGLSLSAAVQGVHVMMTSAVLASWSERLFPTVPSLGFTAALLAMALGSIAGPAVAGVVSDGVGPAVMLVGAAMMPLATALLLRRSDASGERCDA